MVGNPDFTTVASATIAKYRRKLVDNLIGQQALFWQLEKRGLVREDKGGNSIVEPILYGDNSTVSSYAGYDLLDNTPQTGITSSKYLWKYVAGSVVISGQEEFENSGSKEQIFNLLKGKIRQLETSMKKDLNEQLYADGTGNGGKDITGLALAVEEGSSWSTYGGIPSATAGNEWWRNQFLDFDGTYTSFGTTSGTSVEGLDALRSMRNLCTRGHGFSPSLIISGLATYEAYEAYIEGKQLRTHSTSMADAGFRNVEFGTIPWIYDEDMQSDELLMLNADTMGLVVGRGRNMTQTPFQRPDNQDAKVCQVLWAGNLVTSRRDTHGRMTDIVISA